MNVYTVEDWDYIVIKIFLSKEKAQMACLELNNKPNDSGYTVNEYEVIDAEAC